MANTDVTGFWKIAEADPDHLAIVDPDHNQMTYGELYSLTNKIVRGLRAAGLEKGDQVTTVLPNSFEQVAVCLAAFQAGFYVTTVNWHLVGPEISYIVNDSETKALIVSERFADEAVRVLELNSQIVFDFIQACRSPKPEARAGEFHDLALGIPRGRHVGHDLLHEIGVGHDTFETSVLVEDEHELGVLTRESWHSRRAQVSIPTDWPLEIQVFAFWLSELSWQDDEDQNTVLRGVTAAVLSQ